MDDTEDDARYPANPYPGNYHQSYGSSHRPKLPVRNASYLQQVGNDHEEEEEEEEEEEVEEEEEEGEGAMEAEDDDDEEEEENGVQRVIEEADEDEEDAEDDDERVNYHQMIEAEEEDQRHRKKRKLKNLALSYEFVPRVAAPSAAPTTAPKPSFGGRSSSTDWTEHSTFVLLDAWGDRFLQLGRKSLRSDEWHEVANKVSEVSNTVRTDTQCRNRLDTLKKKYKREKMKFAETGNNTTSKWVYFKKMDMLMTSSPRQPGLSCGLDSGEYVFMNPRVYLNRSNGLDEMRDSPGNSESSEGGEDDSDDLPPKREKIEEEADDGSSFKLLADSIQKFGEIYEKTENTKRQQMLELEKMRMDFHRDLELQKRQILERAHAEIAKIRQGDDEEIDVSAENSSG